MAFDAFLFFQSSDTNYLPKGETTDPQFGESNTEMVKNPAFEIKSFNFSVQNNVTIGSGSMGAGAGKAVFEKFKFQKTVDSGSPSLFNACAAGKHIDAAVLVLRKAGGVAPGKSQPCYLAFKFLFCYVDTVAWSGSTGDDVPTEDVSFAYGAMQILYRMQDAKGQLTTTFPAAWSQVTNTSLFRVSTLTGGIEGSAIVCPTGVPSSA